MTPVANHMTAVAMSQGIFVWL